MYEFRSLQPPENGTVQTEKRNVFMTSTFNNECAKNPRKSINASFNFSKLNNQNPVTSAIKGTNSGVTLWI
jgi:hypothetical protein